MRNNRNPDQERLFLFLLFGSLTLGVRGMLKIQLPTKLVVTCQKIQIRIDLISRIRICIEVKCWIRILIETNVDSKNIG
jgi:hypothetical protein